MKRIERNEILPLGEYEQVRPHFRARVIEVKKSRRAKLSDIMSVTFENRDTVLLQIQEILRIERITAEDGIQHEIDTYNDFIPAAGELSMTLFIEIADKDAREAKLNELAGLERAVFVDFDGERIAARGEDRSVEGIERTTALHYLKVPVGEERLAKLGKGSQIKIVIDHPKCQLEVPLSEDVLRSLAADQRL